MTAGTDWYGYAEPQPQGYYYPEQPVHQAYTEPVPTYYEQQQQPVFHDPAPAYAEYQHQYAYQYEQQPQYAEQPQYYAEYATTTYLEPVADLTELEFDLEFDAELLADPEPESEPLVEFEPEFETEFEPESAAAAPHVVTGGRAAARAARGRTNRRRSAVLTIAVPSVAVLGIAGAAAASLAPGSPTRPVVASDAAASLTAADQQAQAEAAVQARASAEQASRDQARQALALRTAAAKKAAAEAPRYVMPITEHTGLSALFGQSGTHWMQLHTGIDFPVSTGTSVHAVTDGTITTKWNAYYGNMLMLTAPDGTQTWYCHLSAYKKRSGAVKAGDIIAYSGDTGNSTGPHLHFEVHPDGGPAIDPLPWLLAHHLDPR